MLPSGWPIFFAKRALKAKNITIRAGEPFPYQDLKVIQGFGEAYGVKDAHLKSAAELDYVEVVDVHARQMAHHVLQQGLMAATVKKTLAAEVSDAG